MYKRGRRTFMVLRKEELLGLMLLGLSLMLGTFYGVSRRYDTSLFYVLEQYFTATEFSKAYWELFKQALWIHTLQLGGIWLSGLTKPTQLISALILGTIGFSYGFTVTSFLLLYGLKGFWLALGLFGIQGVVLLLGIFYIGLHGVRFVQKGREYYLKTYLKVLGCGGILVIALAFVDTAIQPIIPHLIK